MQVRATSGRDVVAGTTGASPHNLRARKRCSRATFSWGEKHTDLELVIRKDYQLFCSVLASAFRPGAQNSAALVGFAEESTRSESR